MLIAMAFPVGAGAQRVLTVGEMFNMADANNMELRASSLDEQAAGENVSVARNGRLPSLEASLSASYIGNGWMSDRNFSNGHSAEMPHFGNNFAFKATQVIYAGGAVSREIELADLRHQIACLRHEDREQEVRFLLLGWYLGIYQLRNQEIVYRKNIEQTEMLVEDIEASYRQGVALKSDVTRYRLQLQDLNLGLAETLNDRDILNHQLCVAIGLDPGVRIEVDTTLLQRGFLPASEGYWLDAAADSPVIRIADKSVEAGDMSVKLARAGNLPQIAFTAADSFDGPILIEVPPMDYNFNYWYAGIGIKYSFDSIFKGRKKVRKAKTDLRKSMVERDLAWQKKTDEVHAAYVKLDEAFLRKETMATSVLLATENYDEMRNRYLNGLVLVTDMIDGSNTKLKAELDYEDARINILYRYYLLEKTVGLL